METTKIRGSYAGAMGISQFMPSNAYSLAKDGNGNGRIDLFEHPDASSAWQTTSNTTAGSPGSVQKSATG